MANGQLSGNPSRNCLLAKLSPERFDSLCPNLERVELKVPQVLSEPNEPIEFAYFPESGMISIVSIMNDGDSIEVGTIGREGMSGAELLLGSNWMPFRCFVQADGIALRIEGSQLKHAVERDSGLERLLFRYVAAVLTRGRQAAACNGKHSVHKRCCRWLLMARDRSDSDELSMIHDFLALMLGVRRASVSEVLEPLQKAGLVRSNRGRITVLNRTGLEQNSCECYRAIVNQFNRKLGSPTWCTLPRDLAESGAT